MQKDPSFMADKRSSLSTRRSRGSDFATVAGIGGALLLITIALILGGSPEAFLNIESVLIVIGGTLAVTLASFTFRDFVGAISQLRSTITKGEQDPRVAALKILTLADFARKQGVLRLQGVIMDDMKRDPFLYKALSLVVDGLPEDEVQAVLFQDIQTNQQRLSRSVAVLRRGAEVAPAMGLIGTMIGLVQMLGRLTEPSTIGPGMAVALLTTFYGAILGNVVLLPLAGKMERTGLEDVLIARIYVAGAISISRKENPRRLEMLLNSLLPTSSPIQFYD